jgi:hypothetical protein
MRRAASVEVGSSDTFAARCMNGWSGINGHSLHDTLTDKMRDGVDLRYKCAKVRFGEPCNKWTCRGLMPLL